MTTNAAPLSQSWRQALLLLAGLIGWIGFWYWETLVAMIGIWERSETYAHAFVVPPITLWLIWRQRKQMLVEQPCKSLLYYYATPIHGTWRKYPIEAPPVLFKKVSEAPRYLLASMSTR